MFYSVSIIYSLTNHLLKSILSSCTQLVHTKVFLTCFLIKKAIIGDGFELRLSSVGRCSHLRHQLSSSKLPVFTTSSIAVSVDMRYFTSHLLNVIGTFNYEIYIFAITGNNDGAFFSRSFRRTS